MNLIRSGNSSNRHNISFMYTGFTNINEYTLYYATNQYKPSNTVMFITDYTMFYNVNSYMSKQIGNVGQPPVKLKIYRFIVQLLTMIVERVNLLFTVKRTRFYSILQRHCGRTVVKEEFLIRLFRHHLGYGTSTYMIKIRNS